MAKFGKRHIFGEPGHAESSVVHQHINAVMAADDLFHRDRQRLEFGDVKPEHVNAVPNAGLLGRLFQPAAVSEVPHGGNHAEAVLRQLDGGQQSNAAGASGNNCDSLWSHGSPPNPANRRTMRKATRSGMFICARQCDYEKITGLHILS